MYSLHYGSKWVTVFYAFTYFVLILLLNKSTSWVVTVYVWSFKKDFKLLLQGTHKIYSTLSWTQQTNRMNDSENYCENIIIIVIVCYEVVILWVLFWVLYVFTCVAERERWMDGCGDVENCKIEISPELRFYGGKECCDCIYFS